MGLVTRQLKRWRRETAPDASFKEALWYELDAAFVRMYPSSAVSRWRRMILYPAAAMAIVVTMGTGTYAYASPSVNSQSVLYPLKRGMESVEERFYASPSSLADFHMRMMERRLQEGEMLLGQTNAIDDASLDDAGEEMHITVVHVVDTQQADLDDAAREAREQLIGRLRAEHDRYEYLLNRANEVEQERLLERHVKLRNTIEQIRVRVSASELSEEEKDALLLHLPMKDEADTTYNH